MSILSMEVKTKKAEKEDEKTQAFERKLNETVRQFESVWREGSYLVCNYRLDIAAK